MRCGLGDSGCPLVASTGDPRTASGCWRVDALPSKPGRRCHAPGPQVQTGCALKSACRGSWRRGRNRACRCLAGDTEHPRGRINHAGSSNRVRASGVARRVGTHGAELQRAERAPSMRGVAQAAIRRVTAKLGSGRCAECGAIDSTEAGGRHVCGLPRRGPRTRRTAPPPRTLP